jgi:predicted O-methyltransferase YrrM
MTDLAGFMRMAAKIPGWTRDDEAGALARVAYDLPPDAVIVEIGSFLGASCVLLAGARKLRGSGKVHCVDPFDLSGDRVSIPHYGAIIMAFGGRPPRELFDENIGDAGLADWVEVHQGRAQEMAVGWSAPIDLLFLDGDQSPAGARAAFEAWSPWLKQGGVIALHNSNPRDYAQEHDGHYRIVVREIRPPRYVDRRVIGTTTFARKAA